MTNRAIRAVEHTDQCRGGEMNLVRTSTYQKAGSERWDGLRTLHVVPILPVRSNLVCCNRIRFTIVAFKLARGEASRREHPPRWGCVRRATTPWANFNATRRAAVLFRADFVARSLQIHFGICSGARAEAPRASSAQKIPCRDCKATSVTAH